MEHILACGRATVVSDLPGAVFSGVCETPAAKLRASRALCGTTARQKPTFRPPSWPPWPVNGWGGAFRVVRHGPAVIPRRTAV